MEIYGHIIDENYSKILIEQKDLSLNIVISLDRVQKQLNITDKAARKLKSLGLIEGRRPNYYVAAHIAEATKNKAEYIKNRGFDDAYYRRMIIELIKEFGSASKKDIDDLILDKLSDVLDDKKKKTY